jgi:FemAB-related protein (PEP-CTERM system-associated)
MFSLRLTTDYDREKWDSFVATDPEAGPYHWYAWKRAVEKAYHHKGFYLMAEKENGECLGVLPLICIKMPWGRKILVSLPYCDYAGPLGAYEVKKALIDKALYLASKEKAYGIEIRFPSKPDFLNENIPENSQINIHKVRMLRELPLTSSELWSEFKPKLRAQIRRPQKEGLKEELGGKELLNDFYRVFNLNMHRLGSPVHDRKWFENLLEEYGDKAKVGIVRHKNGVPVAGGILLTIGQKACVPWASSLREYNPIAPNMLLYYRFLAWSSENGYKQFDFGRSTPGEGTYKFKEQWGSFPQPLHWFKQEFNGAPKTGIISKSGARDKMASIWCKLPLPIASFLGPKLRKYISL